MDTNEIIQLINGVGFPIVACGALFWWMNKTQEKNTQAIVDVNLAITKFIGTIDELADAVKELKNLGGMVAVLENRLKELEGKVNEDAKD